MGALIAIVELWIAFSYPGDPWIPIGLAVLGASLAMVGSGAWSIDARLFGRKHIYTPEPCQGFFESPGASILTVQPAHGWPIWSWRRSTWKHPPMIKLRIEL